MIRTYSAMSPGPGAAPPPARSPEATGPVMATEAARVVKSVDALTAIRYRRVWVGDEIERARVVTHPGPDRSLQPATDRSHPMIAMAESIAPTATVKTRK